MKRLLFLILLWSATAAVFTQAAPTLATRLAGRIVLAVEEHGEAWYIDPLSLSRVYLGRPDDAFALMRQFGLGITNRDLAKIPVANSHMEGDLALRQRLQGRILLQVEEHGEAWYVDPVTLRREYLGRPLDALNIMRQYGLGITSTDLQGIPMHESSPVQSVRNAVPFASQAPFGEWSDPRQQDGCEEAAALMAVAWARKEDLSLQVAKDQILSMSDWQEERYGTYVDTGIHDTADRLLKNYLDFSQYQIQTHVTTSDLITLLDAGSIALVPINGQIFEPFHYSPPGPERHMIVVHGYDAATNSFLAHDPGTSVGANLVIDRAILENSWRDYASGDHVPVPNLPKSLIVISR